MVAEGFNAVETLRLIEEYGRAGWIVSICFGPCGEEGKLLWSVDVLNRQTQKEFDAPFAASSFEDIAYILHASLGKPGDSP